MYISAYHTGTPTYPRGIRQHVMMVPCRMVSARRRIYRRILRMAGHAMLRTLTRTTITGTHHLPRRGPYIIAGNHRGIMEVALMMLAAPADVEIIGAGEIPLDRRYRYFAHMYGYIPYRRGQLDRAALRRALEVLQQGGIVGIFPEGGIWQTERTSAHRGVAWLAFSTGVPVIPIGFAGVQEGIHKTVTLQFPRFEGHVGAPVLPGDGDTDGPRRDRTESFAESVLDRIEDLIPDWDANHHHAAEWESFSLEAELLHHETAAIRFEGTLTAPELIARLIHLPLLIDTVYYNLKRRSVRPLRHAYRTHRVDAMLRAVRVLIGYSTRTNPAYFSYRLGAATATRLLDALRSLERYLAAVPDPAARVRITGVYRFRMAGDEGITEWRRPRRSRRL